MAANNRKKYNKYNNYNYYKKFNYKYYNIIYNTFKHSQIINYYINILIKLRNIIVNNTNNNKKIDINIFVSFIKYAQLSNPSPSQNKYIISMMNDYIKKLNKEELEKFNTLYNNISNSHIYLFFQNYFYSQVEKNKSLDKKNLLKKKELFKNI